MILALDAAQLSISIGVVLGAIGSIYGTWRLARKDRSKDAADNAAVLLGGWRDFQAETLKEVERVRASLQQQIADLKAEHAIERAEWVKDSEAKQKEIDDLKAQIIILIRETRG